MIIDNIYWRFSIYQARARRLIRVISFKLHTNYEVGTIIVPILWVWKPQLGERK